MHFVNLGGITLIILAVACFLRTRETSEVFFDVDGRETLGHFFIGAIGVGFLLAGIALVAISSS